MWTKREELSKAEMINETEKDKDKKYTEARVKLKERQKEIKRGSR